jgi:prophage regulatory protein
MTNSDQLLRIAAVSELTSLAKSTINLWVAQGKFPRPIALSPTIKVWRSQQITDWVNSLCKSPDQNLDDSVDVSP